MINEAKKRFLHLVMNKFYAKGAKFSVLVGGLPSTGFEIFFPNLVPTHVTNKVSISIASTISIHKVYLFVWLPHYGLHQNEEKRLSCLQMR